MKKAIIITLAIVAIVIGVLLPLIFMNCRDIPPPDTSDLEIVRPAVAPEENAYTYFRSAVDSFYWPTNGSFVTNYLAGNPVAEEALTDILIKNEQALELVKRGTACRICLLPKVTRVEEPLPVQSSTWRGLGRVLALKTRQARLAGRYADAATDCIALLKFGDMIQAETEVLIYFLAGIAILESGLAQARDLARDQNTPPAELKRISDCLAALGPVTPGYVRAFKGEYLWAANTIDQVRDGKIGLDKIAESPISGIRLPRKGAWLPGYLFQPNKTKLISANYYRGVISNASRCYADIRAVDWEALFDTPVNIIDLVAKPNALGRILCDKILPSFSYCLEMKCRFECSFTATRLVVACNAYRKKEGNWPADLQALAPAYLAAVPADPCDGKPFRYSAAKGIVYSVGKNLEDSGGSIARSAGDILWDSDRQRWEAVDYVFELDFPSGNNK
jgi:hypothetical protein